MSKLKLLLPLILISGASNALQGTYDIDGYTGLEAKIRKMDFKKNFGKNVFEDSKCESLNAFVGFKLNKYFGIEYGYELSDNKIQARYIKNGKCIDEYGFSFLEKPQEFDSLNNFFNSRSKVSGFNIDLMGFFPINDSRHLNMICSAGLGYLKSEIKYDLFEIAEKNITLHDGYNIPLQRFAHTRSKYKARTAIIRISYGIQYTASSGFGVRALAGWENTHKIKMQGKDRDTGKKVNEYAKFKDSITYRIGFFVPF